MGNRTVENDSKDHLIKYKGSLWGLLRKDRKRYTQLMQEQSSTDSDAKQQTLIININKASNNIDPEDEDYKSQWLKFMDALEYSAIAKCVITITSKNLCGTAHAIISMREKCQQEFWSSKLELRLAEAEGEEDSWPEYVERYETALASPLKEKVLDSDSDAKTEIMELESLDCEDAHQLEQKKLPVRRNKRKIKFSNSTIERYNKKHKSNHANDAQQENSGLGFFCCTRKSKKKLKRNPSQFAAMLNKRLGGPVRCNLKEKSNIKPSQS